MGKAAGEGDGLVSERQDQDGYTVSGHRLIPGNTWLQQASKLMQASSYASIIMQTSAKTTKPHQHTTTTHQEGVGEGEQGIKVVLQVLGGGQPREARDSPGVGFRVQESRPSGQYSAQKWGL
jgi:hypothetical protein